MTNPVNAGADLGWWERWKCNNGWHRCPLLPTGQRFAINFGFGKTEVRYGAMCTRCGKRELVESQGCESWRSSDEISENEAYKRLNEIEVAQCTKR